MDKKKLSYWDFDIICRPLMGLELVAYGMPYRGAFVYLKGEDALAEMFNIVENYPRLHIASYDDPANGFNRFIKGKSFYRICSGNADSAFEICPIATDLKMSQQTDEDRLREQQILDEFVNNGDDTLYQSVVNWRVNEIIKSRDKKNG